MYRDTKETCSQKTEKDYLIVKDEPEPLGLTSESKVKKMAVSLKPMPVFKGEKARQLLKGLDNPKSNKDFFAKLESTAKIIKVKK